jgi:hypothetical protein
MRNRSATGLLLLLVLAPGAPATADSDNDADEAAKPDAGLLAPIDLGAIAPIRSDLEHYDAAMLRSQIVCQRVRTIRSWIPREVCVTRAQLARLQDDRRERVDHDIRTLREIQRYQMRNSRGGWRQRARY